MHGHGGEEQEGVVDKVNVEVSRGRVPSVRPCWNVAVGAEVFDKEWRNHLGKIAPGASPETACLTITTHLAHASRSLPACFHFTNHPSIGRLGVGCTSCKPIPDNIPVKARSRPAIQYSGISRSRNVRFVLRPFPLLGAVDT